MMYFTPFLEGRDAALAKALKSAEGTTGNINFIAAVVALIGMAKLLIGRQLNKYAGGGQTAQRPDEYEPVIRSS